MFNFSINGVTVATVRDGRRKTDTDLCPIRIRVTYRRQQIYYSTGFKMNSSDWGKLKESKSKMFVDIRESLGKVFEITKLHIQDMGEKNTFSFDSLEKRLGSATGDTINTAFQNKIANLYKNKKISTGDWYKNTLRNIELFAGNNIKYHKINADWLRSFHQFLLLEDVQKKVNPKSLTSISMFMRALRAIINEAKEVGVIKEADYPFGSDKGKYEIPEPIGRAMALTLKQVGLIVKLECENNAMSRSRDYWFFSYLCNGANITDICKMKFSNIHNGEIYFYRQKTFGKGKKIEIRALITPEMQSIIDTWGNKDKSQKSFIFPILKGNESALDERRIIKNFTRHLNLNMGKVGAQLGIGKISTYTARHSFATVLKRSGANVSSISESLGHRSIKTTAQYLDKFEVEERQRNAKALTNF